MTNEVATTTDNNFQVFAGAAAFEAAQRMAKALSTSTLVPKEYQNNMPNCLIALEMACRAKASPLQVMQNLYIVHGKPSWSSQFIIAAINSSGKFSPLRFKLEGEGDKRICIAQAIEKETGEVLESPPVSIDIAKKEGWYAKNGSKWQTMPELMLRYRAATFFGRLYAPEILMGMKAADELDDIIDITPDTKNTADILNEKYLKPEVEESQPSPAVDDTTNAIPVGDVEAAPQVDDTSEKYKELIDMPENTPTELKVKADAVYDLIKSGSQKIDILRAVDGPVFLQKLGDAGLMAHRKKIMEL